MGQIRNLKSGFSQNLMILKSLKFSHFGPKIWPISGPKSDILQTLSDPYFYVSAHNVMFIYLVNVLTVTVAVVSSTQGWHILAYNYNGTNFRTNQLLKDQFGERNVHLVPIGPNNTDLPFIRFFRYLPIFRTYLAKIPKYRLHTSKYRIFRYFTELLLIELLILLAIRLRFFRCSFFSQLTDCVVI